jgi:uncharacterized Zn finger protein (UPF0148 family)
MTNKYCIKCGVIIKAKNGGYCPKCALEEYERQKAKNNAPKQTDDKIGTPPSADR